MHLGFRIVEDMAEGLSAYLPTQKGMKSIAELPGRAALAAKVGRWENLDLHYQRVARIDYGKCIGCNLCYIACEERAHQCDRPAKSPDELGGVGLGPGRVPHKPVPKVREDCVGDNLCALVPVWWTRASRWSTSPTATLR